MNDTATYEVTAKTVEEAIAKANREYGDESHEVSCEILEMPKKGFLGLGSKEAKIRVTVTETVSVQKELGSLVADIKGMKSLTDRGGDDRNEQQQKNQNNQQKNNQNNQQKNSQQKNNQQKKNDQNNRNDQQRKNDQNGRNDQQRKNDRNDRNDRRDRQQPKQENRPAQQPAAEEPKEARRPLQNGEKRRPPLGPKAEILNGLKKEESEPVEKKAPAFGDDYTTSLGNQAKPSTRRTRNLGGGEEVSSSGITVSEPMGLTDFVAEDEIGEFSETAGNGGDRMNNDVRRDRRKEAKKNAEALAEGKTVPVIRTVPSKGRSGRNSRPGKPMRSERYDMAESDADYEKLERMVRESEDALDASYGLSGRAEPPVREERRREAVTQAEMDFALSFANQLLSDMNLNAEAVAVPCPEDEPFETNGDATVYPMIDIVGDDAGILIGHHGETLDAIQYLVNLSALRKAHSKDGDYVKIVVNIENYRKKREDTLRLLARRMAARAVKTKRNVHLEPMNAYERRIIHSELQSFENVSTHSVGSDRDRKIIITYEGADRIPEKPRRRREEGNRPKKPAETSSQRSDRTRRRARKIQKMPIESLNDFLPSGEPESSDATDGTAEE